MAPRSKKQTQCQICSESTPKYTCSKCYIAYCSVPCYKEHQQSACVTNTGGERRETSLEKGATMASANSEAPTSAQPLGVNEEPSSTSQPDATSIPDAEKPKPLRPLTSVNWPYAPEESAFPDPLKRDDPKDLQLHHYEAIAMSGKIREIFNKHENLPALLTSIDRLRGIEREEALQKALGVTPPDIDDWRKRQEPNEEVLALRELAEAVENAIRGGNDAALGLNWEDES